MAWVYTMFLKKLVEKVVEYMEKATLDPDRMLLKAEDVGTGFPYFVTSVREFEKGLMLQVVDHGSPQQVVDRINRDLKNLMDDDHNVNIIYTIGEEVMVYLRDR